MSNWLSEFSGEEQRQVDELNKQGVTGKPAKKKDVGLFDGVADSPIRGAGVGFIKVADTLAKPLDFAGDAVSYAVDYAKGDDLPSFNDYRANAVKQRDDLVFKSIEALEDRENTGLIGNIGVGLGDYIWRGFAGGAIGGVAGAATLTGGTTGHYQYNNLRRKDVDSYTALQVAGVNAVGDAAATALPLSYGFKGAGGVVKDGVLSIGGATGLLTGMRFTSGEVLRDAGYEEQSKQFEATKETVLTDLVLNTLLFGAARGVAHRNARLSQEVEAEIRRVSDDPDIRSDVINETLVRNELDFESTLTPVHTSDPIQQNNHLQNLNTAMNQIQSGQPVNVPHNIELPVQPRQITIPRSEYKSIRYDDPRLDAILHSKAKQMGMEWATPLLLAIRRAGEKSHNNQVSPKGAQSVMQIMPDTKAGLERNYNKQWDIDNPEHATEMALYLVREISETYKSKNPEIIAAHYNGGFANGKAVQGSGKAKSRETIDYVNRIREFLDSGQDKKYTGNNITTAYDGNGKSYDFTYEVKSLDDLITSNDAMFGVNPRYPAELQPRDRTREASRQQIERMADDLKPELLGESAKISDGAPIAGLDGVIESGNGRMMAIRQAAENGKADPYFQMVNNFAAARGWDISGINNPVLVRTRLSDVDRVEFSRPANESDVAQFSASERAKTDVDRLPDASLLRLNSDGNINLDGSMDYVRAFMDQIPQSERGPMQTPDGRLTQEGKRRIETALANQAYGDSNLVARLSENMDDNSRTVLNALLRSAPQLAQLADLVKQGGRHANTIAKDLAAAAQKLSDLKANGLRVDDYLGQGQLIDDGLSPGAKEFLQVFDQNSRSSKAINDVIKSKIDEVDAMGDPRQGSLFGDTPEDIAFMNILNENPNQMVSVKRISDEGVEVETEIPLHQLVSELEMDAKQAEIDNTATQAAISCALQFGE